ncbi:T9SS sorting signal type C domain-containing protein [Flavobacterium sp.]|uniref:T9SS sorting signal type C domain-containing protein n=1 Tax=Flavobacterium sp. TaxID=239 RepID=UPI00286E20A1|nr:T9SS sorting signal type C domain-containing protein [Flavobacterium sp.]
MKLNLLSTYKSTWSLLLLLLTFSFANAANITSTGSGNWNSTVVNAPWPGGVVPSVADNVTIAAGHTVTVTVSASITNLILSNTTSKLIINSSQTLTVTGTFTNSGTTTNGVNGPGTIMFTGTATFGSLTPTGTRPNVIIGNGISANTVTVGANTLVADLTVNTLATLSFLTRTIAINGFFSNSGTVTGTTGQVNPVGNFTNSGTFSLTTGQINVTTGNFSSTNSLVYSGAGFLRLGGAFTYSGTFTLGSAQVQFTGAANQSIPAFTTTGTVSMIKTGGTATLTGNATAGGLTLNGLGGTLDLVSGTHTFNGTWTRTNGTLNCGSSLLKIGLSISGTGGTFNAGTGTVEYYRAGNQTIAALTYNNMTLSGSGTKTITTATTIINRVLSMEGTATASAAPTYTAASATLRYNILVARTIGAEWVTPFAAVGGVVISGIQTTTMNVAKVFNVGIPLTINSGAKLATANLSLTLGGDFINTGGTFTAGSSPIVITNTMATQSIAGFTTTGLVSMTKTAGTATFGGNVNGAGFTINGAGGTLDLGAATHTLTGAVTLTTGTLNAGSSILRVNFTGTAWAGNGTLFARGTGTVNFGGVAQTLNAASTVFNNLTFSNSGLKTLTAVPTVNGILSMEGTSTVSVAPNYGAAATLQYNRTLAQVAGVEWITPFVATGGLSTIGIGTITANAIKVFNATVPLNIGTGATLNNGGFSISGGSTLTVASTGTLQLTGVSIFPAFTTTTLATNSTVNYSGTAQTVAVQSYGILLLSGSGNKTFAGATTIAGDLGISGTAVALLLNGTTSTSGTLTLGGVLQTTLGSYGGTGSAATNKNGTWFGSTTTGIINVITACISGTWLGRTNTDWNTGTNWCGGSIPTASSNVTIGTTTNQPFVGASGGICRDITISTGATLTISGSNTLTVRGNWTNSGTFTSNTSTVVFSGTLAQTIGGSSVTTFNNLTNANISDLVSASRAITVKNSLNITNSASVLDMGTFALTDGGTFSNIGVGQLKTSNTSILPIPSAKTWTCLVTYFNVTGGQSIVAGTYNGTPSLELDNTSGTQTASGNIVTGGQLNINNGGTPLFDMNGFNLTTNALNVLAPNSVLNMRAGTLTCTSVPSMDGTVRFSGVTNGVPFASGTVEYYGTTQTVTSGNYFKLLFSGASGVYTMSSDIDVASTLNITNGAVTLKDGFTLSVDDALTVVNPATLTIENNATLLQTTYTGANNGNVIIQRNTTPVVKFDATYWCSPTTGTQTLYDFSPLTTFNRFNSYDSVNDVWIDENPTTTVFRKGIGYSIRCPSDTPITVPTIVPYQFVGVPNNGSFTIPLSTPPADIGISLIGNPYPSALNAEDFINENLYDAILNPTNVLNGTYYLWSHNTSVNGLNFTGDDYFTCNLSGATGFANFGTGNNTIPTGFIASGQGFFVENEIAGNLKFNNSMRELKNNTNFYKTKNTKKSAELEKHRIWLNITDSAKTTGNQMLVGYVQSATNNYESGYDSYLFDDTKPLLIYSRLGTINLSIQGRALPFVNSDTVQIGYYTKIADNVTIAINSVDGLFLDSQGIYLEDKLLNVIYDLKSDPYVFASEAGTFDDRFVLRYTDGTLGTKNFDGNENKVLLSIKNKQIKINSFAETIDKVIIYDLLGRQIYQKENINNNEFTVSNFVPSRQTLIVKTNLQNGKTITNKIIY